MIPLELEQRQRQGGLIGLPGFGCVTPAVAFAVAQPNLMPVLTRGHAYMHLCSTLTRAIHASYRR